MNERMNGWMQNLSKNELGHAGAVAVGNMLDNDNELLYLDLSGQQHSLSISSHSPSPPMSGT